MLGLAGRVPEPGEEFTINGLVFEVVRVQGRRVAEVIVRRAQPVRTGDPGPVIADGSRRSGRAAQCRKVDPGESAGRREGFDHVDPSPNHPLDNQGSGQR